MILAATSAKKGSGPTGGRGYLIVYSAAIDHPKPEMIDYPIVNLIKLCHPKSELFYANCFRMWIVSI
jgi:hypothetical protein